MLCHDLYPLTSRENRASTGIFQNDIPAIAPVWSAHATEPFYGGSKTGKNSMNGLEIIIRTKDIGAAKAHADGRRKTPKKLKPTRENGTVITPTKLSPKSRLGGRLTTSEFLPLTKNEERLNMGRTDRTTSTTSSVYMRASVGCAQAANDLCAKPNITEIISFPFPGAGLTGPKTYSCYALLATIKRDLYCPTNGRNETECSYDKLGEIALAGYAYDHDELESAA